MTVATLICKETKIEFYGVINGPIRKGIKEDGTILNYWEFITHFGGDECRWECHSDYWDIVIGDKRKHDMLLSHQKSYLDKVLSKITQFGWCKS